MPGAVNRRWSLGAFGLVAAFALIALFFPTPGLARQYPIPDSAEVTVMTPDSLELVGYLYWPKLSKPQNLPLVILLHQATETHAMWSDFGQALCSDGLAVFAMDLRGYGLSTYEFNTGRVRPPNTFYVGEFVHYPDDVALILQKVFASYGNMLDSSRLAMVGAEIGANTGMLVAANDLRFKFVALISPGLEYKALRLAPAVKEYGDRPLYIVTSSKDLYSSESCNMLSDVVPRVLDIKVYDSYRYGVALLYSEPDLMPALASKVVRYLDQAQVSR